VSTISANPEPVELEPAELVVAPRLPDELDPLAADDEPAPEELVEPVEPAVPVEPVVLDEPVPPDTGSPGLRLSSETIVPALGATKRVSARVV
jgi:hypothetical protein